jgi:hypothetical protein
VRSLFRRLQFFATILDGRNVAILRVDGKDQSIARTCVDNNVVPSLGDTKGYIPSLAYSCLRAGSDLLLTRQDR